MKNLYFFIISAILALSSHSLPAQTPQYYNYNISEHTNYFPFGAMGGKGVQWLFPPGNLNQPAPIRSGVITKVYFFMGYMNGSADFWNVTIKLGQSSITNLPAGVIYTGPLDTVYFRANVHLNSIAGQWMGITLDHPFVFDSAQTLIADVSQCGATNNTLLVCQHTYTGIKRTYYDYTPYMYRGQDSLAVNFGVDIIDFVSIWHSGNSQPKVYSLEQNYPNPFNPITKISYGIPKSEFVKITVLDVLGRVVSVPVNGFKTAGSYNIEFDASELSSGVYFYRLEAGDFRDVKKMTLVK